MTFKEEFSSDSGWSVADTNSKLNTATAASFLRFLTTNGVSTVIRYYASSERRKTLSANEAQMLSAAGFSILPVYQDTNRGPEDFGGHNGSVSADNALSFARRVGQPEGTTILFAVDVDFSMAQIDRVVVPYFDAIKTRIGGRYRIGAYASGACLTRLLALGLIEVPWLTMSRGFLGTKEFFFGGDWAMRQVPPDLTHPGSGVSYDRNVSRWAIDRLGAFRVGQPAVVLNREGGAEVIVGAGAGAAPAFVKTEGLNLRQTPNGTIIRPLTLAEPVTDLGPADTQGWRNVQVGAEQGVVFAKYLREPATAEIEALVAACVTEWLRFNKGTADEKADPFFKFVGEMWQAIGLNHDGRSKDQDGNDIPWSAAFISFVVRRAGPKYAQFKFAQGHSKFSNDAIQARVLQRQDKPFWGFRATEVKPEVGDIIHRNRSSNGVMQTFSYDLAANHSDFTSHSDIVMEVTEGVARVIGGNIGDTVSMNRIAGGDNIQEYDLDDAGFLRSGQHVIAILKNRAADVPG
jgi:hypothetical protein